jgi:hypothetical protein
MDICMIGDQQTLPVKALLQLQGIFARVADIFPVQQLTS